MSRRCRERSRLRQRDGIALPLALFALVIISLLVTTALVTSSTELATSVAYQEARERLFNAEDAIQRYIGRAVEGMPEHRRIASTVASGARLVVNESDFRVSVAELGQKLKPSADSLSREETYSLVAFPEDGGRTVGSLVTATRTVALAGLNVDAPLMIGSLRRELAVAVTRWTRVLKLLSAALSAGSVSN